MKHNHNEWLHDASGNPYSKLPTARQLPTQPSSADEWHGLPPARTRAAKKADRLLDGFIVILHLAVAGLIGVFSLSMLGYIDDPLGKKQAPIEAPTLTRSTLPAIGSDLCGN